MKEEVNAEPATADTAPEKHPPEPIQRPINNNVDEDTHEKGASNQLTPGQGQSKENNPPPTTTAPNPN